ncbi:MAG TPA: hypothetical protein DHV22_14230 [Xanthomarina gelatinilytica]|uniref:Lipocalin-like domain-containing protein n=1 Tax=Xanthomarina gelatinilytica TaxID=1137281 RepID=A0A3D6BUK7_9FLAO|nr:hypothetical protein [Xanthomarina gelatinilytica]
MKSKFLYHGLMVVIALPTLFYVSCQSDDLQDDIGALIGRWKVVQVNSYYGEFVEIGHNGLDIVEETGDLGQFTFEDFETMEYSFTRNDTIYSNSGGWGYQQDRFREIGFFKTTKLSITVPENQVFDVDFRNSYGPENTIQLFMEPKNLGFGVAVELFLEKV